LNNLTVYGRTNPPCSYCDNLKTLLEGEGVVFEYKDISDQEVFGEFMAYRLRTVPAVFNNGDYLGGFAEIKELLKGE
jgi:glutaredoxin